METGNQIPYCLLACCAVVGGFGGYIISDAVQGDKAATDLTEHLSDRISQMTEFNKIIEAKPQMLRYYGTLSKEERAEMKENVQFFSKFFENGEIMIVNSENSKSQPAQKVTSHQTAGKIVSQSQAELTR